MMPQIFPGGGSAFPPQMYNGAFMMPPQSPYSVIGSQFPQAQSPYSVIGSQFPQGYCLPSGFNPTPQYWMPGMMMPGFPPGTMMPPGTIPQAAAGSDVSSVQSSVNTPAVTQAAWLTQARTMMAMSTEQDYSSNAHASKYAASRMHFSTNTSHSEACSGQPNSLANECRSNAETSGSGSGHTGGVVPEARRLSLVTDDSGVKKQDEGQLPPVESASERLSQDAPVDQPTSVEGAGRTTESGNTGGEAPPESTKVTARGVNVNTSVPLPLIQGNSQSTPSIASRQLIASFHRASTDSTPSGNTSQLSSFIPCTTTSSQTGPGSSSEPAGASSEPSTSTSTNSEFTLSSPNTFTATDPGHTTSPTSTTTDSSVPTGASVSTGAASSESVTEIRRRATDRSATPAGDTLRPSNLPAELPRERRLSAGERVRGMFVHGVVAVLVVCIIALLYRRLFLL